MAFERSCLSDQIRRILAGRIIDGTLRPGERLVEMKIAEEFNSSQTPVREALKELESLRLVESLPHRGTRVREISERETAEAYVVRGALERLAAELAAPALREDLTGLRRSVAGLIKAAKAADLEGYAKHDLDFHRAIVTAAGNQTLVQLWESLSFETRTRYTLARGHQYDWPKIAAWHQKVVDAFESGDGLLAGQLLEEHARSFTEKPQT